MNRIYIAIIIAVILVLLCFAGYIYIKYSTNEMIIAAKQANNAAHLDNIENAKQKVYELEQKWKKHENILSTYIRHTELDELGLIISSLAPLLENGNMSMFYSECKKCINKLDSLLKSEIPSYSNLL